MESIIVKASAEATAGVTVLGVISGLAPWILGVPAAIFYTMKCVVYYREHFKK